MLCNWLSCDSKYLFKPEDIGMKMDWTGISHQAGRFTLVKILVYIITMVTLNYLIWSGKKLFFKLGPTSLGSCGSLNGCREKGLTPDLVIWAKNLYTRQSWVDKMADVCQLCSTSLQLTLYEQIHILVTIKLYDEMAKNFKNVILLHLMA